MAFSRSMLKGILAESLYKYRKGMTQTERAELLYTLALGAIKQGDVNIGKGLLREAVETHPRHFAAAVRSLEALDATVARG